MKNPIAQTKSRYGTFVHFQNDDPIGSCLYYYGEWAQQEMDLFDQILTQQSNVIDVGANIGTHTVYFSSKCNQGTIVAIEPQIYIFEMLATNILVNGCYNTIPIHAGVSDKAGKANLTNINPFSEQQKVNYGEYKVQLDSENGLETNIIVLDQFINMPKFNLLKIDVEGLEVSVLNGAKKLIKQHRPFLYLEFNNKDGNDQLLEKIYQLGYIPFWHVYTKFNPQNFNGKQDNIWEPENFIIEKDTLDRRYEGNAICIPKEMQVPTNLKQIEIGDNLTKFLFENNLL